MIELDIIAQRYHKLPSDLLKMDLTDYQFTQLVAQTALQKESLQQAKAGKRAHGK